MRINKLKEKIPNIMFLFFGIWLFCIALNIYSNLGIIFVSIIFLLGIIYFVLRICE